MLYNLQQALNLETSRRLINWKAEHAATGEVFLTRIPAPR